MSNSEQVVRDFCAAWERCDIEELLGYFTEDAVYHNIPTDPAKGHEAIRGVMNLFVPMSKTIEFRIDHLAVAGDVVFTERVDTFTLDKGQISLPVAGVFEIREGKIAAWRDYFDMQQFMTQFQAVS
ncbi:MAG TPA: limonene-1,2-epoxide hydrolase family protein [Actinomycetota bacterium]|jgi:limonene-1,2-epoxide hydrolase|nr:limonene-1,2-epoxide hydrolase family protein [Actinomycetota bacterium]